MPVGVTCQECQHENPPENRFCGRCGALLTNRKGDLGREPAAVGAELRRNSQGNPSAAQKVAQEYVARVPRTAAPPAKPAQPSQRSGAVSGPSFLGLNEPYADDGKYDDDLYGSGSGGRVAIGFIILVVVAILGYLQWRSTQQGQQANKPVPVTAPEQAPPVNAPPSDPANPQAAAPSANQGAASPAVNNGAAVPGAAPASAGPQSANIGGVASTPSAAAQIPESDKAEEPENAPATAKSTQAEHNSRIEPARDPDVFSQDAVSQAEVYLQGKGVPQNCDEGVGILHAAEARGNIPAIVKLGALYATGACVPRSRVTAYHFFTRAYRMEPHGELLEHNRVMLWDEMSDAERQQASEQDGPLQ